MRLLLPFLFLLFALPVQAQSFETGVEYLNFLESQYGPVKSRTWDYTAQVAHGRNAKRMEKLRQELLQQVKSTRGRLLRVTPYEGDTELRDTIVSFLRVCYYSLRDDLSEFAAPDSDGEITSAKVDAFVHALETVNTRLDRSMQHIEEAMDRFGKRFDIEVTHNYDEVTKKIIAGNRVIDHYNLHNLFLWRCNAQDEQMIKAMNASNFEMMDATASRMADLVAEGKRRMPEFESFDGDPALGKATKDLLGFFDREVNEDFPVQIDFFKKRAAIQAQSAPSDEELGAFNALIAPFNERVDRVQNERTALLNAWNEVAQAFRDRHTPE